MARKAKATDEERQDSLPLDEEEVGEVDETPTEPPEEKIVKPESKESERTDENWQQKFKTLEGIHKQTISELNIIKGERNNFTALSQKLDQYGQTLDLMVEAVSTGFESSEEVQEKLKKQREKAKTDQESYAKSQSYLGRIQKIAGAAGLKQDDEALVPAKEAWAKGNLEEAYDLTVIASIGQKEKPKTTESDEKSDEAKKPRKNLKVITSSSASKSVEDMTPREKILAGLEEARKGQS